ncbi:unnamed protein product [Chrysodeixis includens]|uniref:YqaJ viral recombinase domain-containing protein n=1 Tax=Chrysodeixis includens TaxID=689277 RepID=A0A9N8KW91_CHRIL|nr:unnamed protein product [Chrysodeixis includens]
MASSVQVSPTLPVTNNENLWMDCDDSFCIEVVNYDTDESETRRRIIDVNYFLRQLQMKARHNELFDCKEGYFNIIGERRNGLMSKFKLQCSMCQQIVTIDSENVSDITEKKYLNTNIAATTGIVATGIGHSQFEELFSAMNIPVFSAHTYAQLQNEVYENWEITAADTMQAAVDEEKEIAISEGHIRNGYPVIDVYADGAWSARSYGTNFKALSGAAAIIGRRTGKVVFIGVKNKYCLVCSRAENRKISPPDHRCFKNFEGSSSSMEAEIIAEGFRTSIIMYGVIFKRLIADGDSSTYAKILQSNPYKNQNLTVEKIECRNHILRNFCKKLQTLTKDTKFLLAHRKSLTNQKIMSMRKNIVKSIKYHHHSNGSKNDAVALLHKDVTNSIEHAYGDHRMCHDYNCGQEGILNNGTRCIQNSTFLFRLRAIVSTVAGKSRSLIENVDTNTVERFNNVIAKFVGGKRINFTQRRGYQARCSAAVVSFNKKTAISAVQKNILGNSPKGKVVDIEKRRALKRKSNVEHPVKKLRRQPINKNVQHDYGETSAAPDMLDTELEQAKTNFLENLKNVTADREHIERSTILQRDSSEWLEIRKKIITASNFGPICKRKPTRDTSALVKNLLYKKNLSNVVSIAHGIENEKQALQQIEQQENIKIDPCGLFIDKKYYFIGATPDGLVGLDKVVEVKCSLIATKEGLQKSLENNKIQIIRYNKKSKTFSINKNCNWFYQIQGQLHVTGRDVCIFGLWVSQTEPVYIKYITRDDQFWSEKMEPKLTQFYLKSLLIELVDPRHVRGMPIRNICLGEKENIAPLTASAPESHLEDSDHNEIVNLIPFDEF